MSEEELIRGNFKLKDEMYKQRKEYQETYKDVREEIKDLKAENKGLQQRIDKAIEYITKEYYREHTIPLENLRLENCTYEPSLVALSILQGKE